MARGKGDRKMSKFWDENFVGDEICENCGKLLLDCCCIDEASEETIGDGTEGEVDDGIPF